MATIKTVTNKTKVNTHELGLKELGSRLLIH